MSQASGAMLTIDLTNHEGREWPNIVNFRVGEKLKVVLNENPTTGYRWQVPDILLDKHKLLDVIRVSNSTYQQNPAPKGMTGVGGKKTIEFETLGPGQGDLYLVHGRSWELEKLSISELEQGEVKIIKINVKA